VPPAAANASSRLRKAAETVKKFNLISICWNLLMKLAN
jgi:hypothetical protein